MSCSILTLTFPPGIPGINKIFVHKCPGARPGKFSDDCPGAGKKLTAKCPGAGNFAFNLAIEISKFVVSAVFNCFNIWYFGGTRRTSDTFNTF